VALPTCFWKFGPRAGSGNLAIFAAIRRASSLLGKLMSKLSDAELIARLSDAAKELGIEINVNYSFAQPKEPEE
jgi:hypothetical protein